MTPVLENKRVAREFNTKDHLGVPAAKKGQTPSPEGRKIKVDVRKALAKNTLNSRVKWIKKHPAVFPIKKKQTSRIFENLGEHNHFTVSPFMCTQKKPTENQHKYTIQLRRHRSNDRQRPTAVPIHAYRSISREGGEKQGENEGEEGREDIDEEDGGKCSKKGSPRIVVEAKIIKILNIQDRRVLNHQRYSSESPLGHGLEYSKSLMESVISDQCKPIHQSNINKKKSMSSYTKQTILKHRSYNKTPSPEKRVPRISTKRKSTRKLSAPLISKYSFNPTKSFIWKGSNGAI